MTHHRRGPPGAAQSDMVRHLRRGPAPPIGAGHRLSPQGRPTPVPQNRRGLPQAASASGRRVPRRSARPPNLVLWGAPSVSGIGGTDPRAAPERRLPPVQVMPDHVSLKRQPLMRLAVLLPDVGPQPADNDHRVALTDARGHVVRQPAETAHLDPGRVAVTPPAFRPDPRRAGQPERRHCPIAPLSTSDPA